MPACNIQVLGAQKRTLDGFSSTAMLPHTGFIYYSDIVQMTPEVGTDTLIAHYHPPSLSPFLSLSLTLSPSLSLSLPPSQDIRRKAARIVAAKCTLAARVDSFHEYPDGEIGQSK